MALDRIVRQYVERAITAHERIADALERIGDIGQAQAEADPLTMLNMAISDGMRPDTMPAAEVVPQVEPASHPLPLAGNGITYIYRHPDPAWHIICSRDSTSPSGWKVSIQESGQ